MSGKKLRQRAFAWFMTIAMVLTNITISPLTALTARAEAATVTPKIATVSGQLVDTTAAGEKTGYSFQVKLEGTRPTGVDENTTWTVTPEIKVNGAVDTGGSAKLELKKLTDSGMEEIGIPKTTDLEAGVYFVLKHKESKALEAGDTVSVKLTLTVDDKATGVVTTETARVYANIKDIAIKGFAAKDDKIAVGTALKDITIEPAAADAEKWEVTGDYSWYTIGEGNVKTPVADPATAKIEPNKTYGVDFDMSIRNNKYQLADNLGTAKTKDVYTMSVKQDTTEVGTATAAAGTVLKRTVSVVFGKTVKKSIDKIYVQIPKPVTGEAVSREVGIVAKENTSSTETKEAEGYSATMKWYVGDVEFKGDTYEANKTYTAKIEITAKDDYAFKSEAYTTDTIVSIIGSGEGAAEGSETDISKAGTPEKVTFSIATTKTSKIPYEGGTMQITGVDNGKAITSARTGWGKNVTDEQKLQYNVGFAGASNNWYAADEVTVDNAKNPTKVNNLGTAATGNFVGGKEYWAIVKIEPVSADDSIEVNENTVLKVEYGEETLLAIPVFSTGTFANKFAVKVKATETVISKAEMKIADATASDFVVPGTLNPTSVTASFLDTGSASGYSVLDGSVKLVAEDEALKDETGLKAGETYRLSFILKIEDGYSMADSSVITVKVGDGGEALTARFEGHPEDEDDKEITNQYKYVVTGLKPTDKRALAGTVTIEEDEKTIGAEPVENEGKVSASLTSTDANNVFVDSDELLWSVVDAKGIPAPGISFTEESFEGRTAKAKLVYGGGMVPGTYTVKLTFNGSETVATGTLTIKDSRVTAEITEATGTTFVKLPAPGADPAPEPQELSFTIAVTDTYSHVDTDTKITWKVTGPASLADSNITVGKGGYPASQNVTVKIPNDQTAGKYTLTATITTKAPGSGATYDAYDSNKVESTYEFEVVASNANPVVSAVEIKTIDGSEIEVLKEIGRAGSTTVSDVGDKDAIEFFVPVGTKFAVTAEGESNDPATIGYTWSKVDSGTSALGTTTNAASVEITAGSTKGSTVFKVVAKANESDDDKAAYIKVTAVDYKLGIKVAAANYKELVSEDVTLGTEQAVTVKLYNGTVPTDADGTGDEGDAVIAVKQGAFKDLVTETSAFGEGDVITSKTFSFKANAKVPFKRNIIIAGIYHGLTVEGTIVVDYAWKDIEVLKIADKDPEASDAKEVGDEIYVQLSEAKAGIPLYAKGYKTWTTATKTAAAQGTYKFISDSDKVSIAGATDGELKEESVLYKNTTVTISEVGVYTITVKAQNKDNIDRLKLNDGIPAETAELQWVTRTIKIHVVNYVTAYDNEATDAVNVQAEADGPTTVALAVMSKDENGALSAIPETAEWKLSAQKINGSNPTAEVIAAVFRIKDGVLTVDTAAEIAESEAERKTWTVTATASVGGKEIGAIAVTITKDAVQVDTVTAAVKATADGKKENTTGAYILGKGSAEGDVIVVDVTIAPAGATDKSVDVLVVKKGAEAKLDNHVDGIIKVTTNPNKKLELTLSGNAEIGEYDVYVYHVNSDENKTVKLSSKIEVKVVEYNVYEEDAAVEGADKYVKNAALEIPVMGTSKIQIRETKHVVNVSGQPLPDEFVKVANVTDVKLLTVNDKGEEVETSVKGNANEYVKAEIDGTEATKGIVTLTLKKFSAETLNLVAEVNGQVVPFTIKAKDASVNVATKVYAGDYTSDTSLAPVTGAVALNLNEGDIVTIDAIVSESTNKDLSDANQKAGIEFYVAGAKGAIVPVSEDALVEAGAIIVTRGQKIDGTGASGYHNYFVVKLLEPIYLYASVYAEAAPSTLSDMITVNASKMEIFSDELDAAVPNGYTLEFMASDTFTVKSGKAIVTVAADGSATVTNPDAAPTTETVVWSISKQAKPDAVQNGNLYTVTNLDRKNLKPTEVILSATVGEMAPITKTIVIDKFVPVSKVVITPVDGATPNLIRGQKASVFSVELRGLNGAEPSYPEFTVSVVDGDAGNVSIVQTADGFTIKGRKVTTTPVKVQAIALNGLTDESEAEKSNEIDFRVYDNYIAIGEDKTRVDGIVEVKVGEELPLFVMNGTSAMTGIIWSSSNDKVATVDNNGVVTVVATESDSVVITARYRLNEIETAIDVVLNVSTEEDAVTVKNGDKVVRKTDGAFSVDVKDGITVESAKDGVTVTKIVSSDPGILKVDAKGNIVAVGTGAVTLTTTLSDGTTETVTLYVTDKTNKLAKTNEDGTYTGAISISATDITLNPYKTFAASAERAMIISYEGSTEYLLDASDISFAPSLAKNGKYVGGSAELIPYLDADIMDNAGLSNEQFIKIGMKDDADPALTADVIKKLKNTSVDVLVDLSAYDKGVHRYTIKVKLNKKLPGVTVKQMNSYNAALNNAVKFAISSNADEWLDAFDLQGQGLDIEPEMVSSTRYEVTVPAENVKDFQKGTALSAQLSFAGYRDPVVKTVKFNRTDAEKVSISKKTARIPDVDADVTISGIKLMNAGAEVNLSELPELKAVNENVDLVVYDNNTFSVTFNAKEMANNSNIVISAAEGAQTRNTVINVKKVTKGVRVRLTPATVSMGLNKTVAVIPSFTNVDIDMPADAIQDIAEIAGLETEVKEGKILVTSSTTELTKQLVPVEVKLGETSYFGSFNVNVKATTADTKLKVKGKLNVLDRYTPVAVSMNVKGATDDTARVEIKESSLSDVFVIGTDDEGNAVAVNNGKGTFTFNLYLKDDVEVELNKVNQMTLGFKIYLGDDEDGIDASIAKLPVVQKAPKLSVKTYAANQNNVDAFSKREYGVRTLDLGNYRVGTITDAKIDMSKNPKGILNDFSIVEDPISGEWQLHYNNRKGFTQVNKKPYTIPLIIETTNQAKEGKGSAADKKLQIRTSIKVLIVQ